jgi:hypothetical protein
MVLKGMLPVADMRTGGGHGGERVGRVIRAGQIGKFVKALNAAVSACWTSQVARIL